MATTQHKNPCLGSHEIYNFSRTILDYHQLVYTLFESCPREEDFLRYTSISHFLPLNPPPPPPLYWGSWNLKFLVSSPYRWYIPNFVNIHVGLVVLEENMFNG